jgi:hypothetical protein
MDLQGEEQAQIVIPFALAPALADAAIINYSTSAGAKLYKSAVKPLATKFDCQPATLKVILMDLKDCAMITGWFNILDIPAKCPRTDDPHGPHHHVWTVVLGAGPRTCGDLHRCRESQGSRLHAALPVPHGLLKVVISASCIDTNATTTFIRGRLNFLDTYMKSVDSDVEKFNEHVKNQMDSLNARGQTTQDLLANLFKGYEAALDNTFRAYISKKQDDYHDGVEIAPDHLMQLALNKYRTLVEGGKWNAPTKADEKIIALEAQLKKLGGKNTSKDAPKQKAQGSGKPNKKQARPRGDRPAWMIEPPKQGEPNTKTVSNKHYNWCPKHEAWGIHTPAECEGKGINKVGGKPRFNNKKSGNKPDYKALKLSKALASVIKQEDEDDDE